MSHLTNSPFGKRLRSVTNKELDDDHESPHDPPSPTRGRSRINPIFGVALPVLSMETHTSQGTSRNPSPSSPSSGSSPKRDYGDRYLPSRDDDVRTSYNLMESGGPSTPSKTSRMIPSESDAIKEQSNEIFTTVLHSEVTPSSPRATSPIRRTPFPGSAPTTPTRQRLFAYSSPTHSNPGTPTNLDAPTDEAYSRSPVRAGSRRLLDSPRRQLRSVCKTPYRVLDAPELADDFYLNLVDWSTTNVLGVGLGASVYLWSAQTAAVSKLCDLSDTSDTVSSIAWVQRGSTLAVGFVSGHLRIYDASTLNLLRTYDRAHSNRIGALSWNQHILTSGSRDRMIYCRDVREADQRPFRRWAGHRQEVCGLTWNKTEIADSALLGSGGNDNKVCIWDVRGSARVQAPDAVEAPLFKFHEHTAAVRGMAWDPHVANVLATGGGTQDKMIRFWNTQTGSMLHELDTGSQVCNLTWSLTTHELVSTHGFSATAPQNQICIWKYPSLSMVASLTGHTHRVLYLAKSPDGETIVTGAGDETLRFWSAFPKREEKTSKKESRLDYTKLIR